MFNLFFNLIILLLLSFKSSLYIFEKSRVSGMSFASIFPHCMQSFHSPDLSFTKQFLILMKSRLSVISFMDCAFGVVSKNSLPCLSFILDCLPVSFSRSLWFWHYAFRSMIYFELAPGRV